MELEKFIKETLIAIQKGIKSGSVEGSEVRMPICYKEESPGVEFDLGITELDNKLSVSLGSSPNTSLTRIKFYVPMAEK